MALDLHTVSVNGAGTPPSALDRLRLTLLASAAYVASAAALTVLGSITPGTGFTTLPNLAVSGGTGSGARAKATSLKTVTATVLTPGTGVAINDTFNVVGGTLSPVGLLPAGGASALLTATHIQAVSATVAAGGSGGTNGTQTVTGTTGTGTKFQAAVTIAGNAITAVLSITVAGDYTANMTDPTHEPVTGASLTGAQLNVVMGALTLGITTAGGYSVAPSTTPALTNGTGTGAGVTATLAYGLGTAQITNSGNYSVAPSFTVTPNDGNGTGASIAAGTLGGNGNAIVVGLQGEFPSSYVVHAMATVDCRPFVAYKSNSEFAIALVPTTTGSTLAAGAVDALILG